jgi:hypothetical protein
MPPVRLQCGRARAIRCGLRIEIEFADYPTKCQPRVTFDGDFGAWSWKSEAVLDGQAKLVENLSCLNTSIPGFPSERQQSDVMLLKCEFICDMFKPTPGLRSQMRGCARLICGTFQNDLQKSAFIRGTNRESKAPRRFAPYKL